MKPGERKEEKKQDEKGERKWLLLLLILLLALLLVIIISITVWALFFRSKPSLIPDYAPLEKEPHAEDIGDDDDQKLPQQSGGGAVSLTYTTQVVVNLSGGYATLYFANPTKSNQDILLQIVVQDVIIAQSGTISPGKRVERLGLTSDALSLLAPAGTRANSSSTITSPTPMSAPSSIRKSPSA